MLIVVNDVQPEKASYPIEVTCCGISYVSSFFPTGYWMSVVLPFENKTPFSDSYSTLLFETFIVVNDVHPENALFPIEVILLGILIVVNDVHPRNA